MSNYNRLTRYNGKIMQEDCRTCAYSNGKVCFYKDKDNETIYDIDEDCKKVMLTRLAELEDKIENGTLIEKGYHVRKSYRNHDDQRYKITLVVEHEVDEIGFDGLTKAEAEAKLKELKGEV